MKNKIPNWLWIIIIFLIWRICLFAVAILAPFFIPNFGYQFPYVNSDLVSSGLPSWIWGFGNFDGVHYIRASLTGYESQYSQAFFPLFFLLIKDLSLIMQPILAGLILANLFFLAGLLIFYQLLKFDFDSKVSFLTVIFLIAFPTAFYFGSIYTESLFFFLMVSSLWFLRQNNFFHAGLLSLLVSATRIVGIILFPVIVYEFYLKLKSKKISLTSWEGKKALIGILIAPMGLLLYMLYLKINFKDPLLFINAQPEFGAQRSAHPFILLPQVFYRYFKILTTVPISSQAFLNSSLELIFTLLIILILILSFKKIKREYWFFSVAMILIPTMTGTLLSIPRFSLMTFLVFPIGPILLKRSSVYLIAILICFQIILAAFFLRGYWIA